MAQVMSIYDHRPLWSQTSWNVVAEGLLAPLWRNMKPETLTLFFSGILVCPDSVVQFVIEGRGF